MAELGAVEGQLGGRVYGRTRGKVCGEDHYGTAEGMRGMEAGG